MLPLPGAWAPPIVFHLVNTTRNPVVVGGWQTHSGMPDSLLDIVPTTTNGGTGKACPKVTSTKGAVLAPIPTVTLTCPRRSSESPSNSTEEGAPKKFRETVGVRCRGSSRKYIALLATALGAMTLSPRSAVGGYRRALLLQFRNHQSRALVRIREVGPDITRSGL